MTADLMDLYDAFLAEHLRQYGKHYPYARCQEPWDAATQAAADKLMEAYAAIIANGAQPAASMAARALEGMRKGI